jgi:hypothetical protein
MELFAASASILALFMPTVFLAAFLNSASTPASPAPARRRGMGSSSSRALPLPRCRAFEHARKFREVFVEHGHYSVFCRVGLPHRALPRARQRPQVRVRALGQVWLEIPPVPDQPRDCDRVLSVVLRRAVVIQLLGFLCVERVSLPRLGVQAPPNSAPAPSSSVPSAPSLQ